MSQRGEHSPALMATALKAIFSPFCKPQTDEIYATISKHITHSTLHNPNTSTTEESIQQYQAQIDNFLKIRSTVIKNTFIARRRRRTTSQNTITRRTSTHTAAAVLHQERTLALELQSHLPQLHAENASIARLLLQVSENAPPGTVLHERHLGPVSSLPDAFAFWTLSFDKELSSAVAHHPTDVETEANRAATERKNAELAQLRARTGHSQLHFADLPRILKNRISAHASNARRVTRLAVARREFRAARVVQRRFALEAAKVALALIRTAPPSPTPDDALSSARASHAAPAA